MEKELALARENVAETVEVRTSIDELLAEKQGDLALNDLIDIEGKRSMIESLGDEIVILEKTLKAIHEKISGVQEAMSEYDDRARLKKIKLAYTSDFEANCQQLNVKGLDEKTFKKIKPKINEGGSDYPRALLAYFFAIVSRIADKDEGVFAPIIIDTLNQQEQDKPNILKMFEFVTEKRPEGAQLVLGLVNDYGYDFGGTTFDIGQTKYSLLSDSEYDDLAGELAPYENQHHGISG